jgi:hypothetical protein
MKNEKDVRLAMGRCFQAQKDDNPELCPMYPGEEFLDCYNCTCCDVFNWLLEDVGSNKCVTNRCS